jgi:CrcB protein
VSGGLLIGLGLLGGAGAIARFLLDGSVAARLGRGFPYGTLAVNLTGAFVLGVLVGAKLGDDAYALAGTGFVGAYTTFSTWMLETHRLAEDGRTRAAVANVAGSLALGLLVAWAGRGVGGLL